MNLFFRYEKYIPWILFFIFFIFFGTFGIIKFSRFQYDLLDLAIFDQVMKGFLNGQWFELSIHPHSYLGDHASFILFFLTPLYVLFPSPILLILAQNLFIGLTVFPVFRLCKRHVPSNFAVFISAWFLFNPIIASGALFEFEPLLLSLFFVFWALVFYEEKKFQRFVLFFGLSLLIREDVALFWIFFSLIPIVQKRHIAWALIPLAMSIAWLAVAISLIRLFNPDHAYKFISYYQHLGKTPHELFSNLVFKPWLFFEALFRFQHIVFLFFLLVFSAFLPLWSLLFLIPSIPIFAQLFLSSFGGNDAALFSYYGTLLVPPLVLSSIHGLRAFLTKKSRSSIGKKLVRAQHAYPGLLPLVILCVFLYSIITLSPIPGATIQFFRNPQSQSQALKKAIVQSIPAHDLVMGSYATLPHLTKQNTAYAFHYAWQGTRQFSNEPFLFPKNISSVIMDTDDILSFMVKNEKNELGFQQTNARASHFNNFLESRNLVPRIFIDSMVVFQQSNSFDQETLFTVINQFPSRPIHMRGYSVSAKAKVEQFSFQSFQAPVVSIELSLRVQNPIQRNDLVQWIWETDDGKSFTEIFPIAYGLFPTSQWKTSDIITSRYRLLIPQSLQSEIDRGKTITLSGQIVNSRGRVTLSRIRSSEIVYKSILPMTDPFEITEVSKDRFVKE